MLSLSNTLFFNGLRNNKDISSLSPSWKLSILRYCEPRFYLNSCFLNIFVLQDMNSSLVKKIQNKKIKCEWSSKEHIIKSTFVRKSASFVSKNTERKKNIEGCYRIKSKWNSTTLKRSLLCKQNASTCITFLSLTHIISFKHMHIYSIQNLECTNDFSTHRAWSRTKRYTPKNKFKENGLLSCLSYIFIEIHFNSHYH